MPTYEITVKAVNTKTYQFTVEALSEIEAQEIAGDNFDPEDDEPIEDYDEEVINVEEIGI